MRDLVGKLAKKKLNLDLRTLDLIAQAEAEGIVAGGDLELLRSLRGQYEDRKFFTEPQRALVRKVLKDYEDYELMHATCKRLAELYGANALPPSSYAFVESVIAWFNENHRWSPLQLEQIIGILQAYDTEKDEAE